MAMWPGSAASPRATASRIEEAKILFTAIVEQYDGEDRANVPALAEQARETLRALDD